MDLGWTASRGLRVGLWILAVGFAFLAVATAQPPTEAGKDNETVKPPWEWTLEERLNARFDPQKIRERMRNRGHNLDQPVPDAARPEGFEILSGRKHPHLFLPTVLFDRLLTEAFYTKGDSFQGWRGACAERYGGTLEIDADFWRDLSILTATYLTEKSQFEKLEAELQQAHQEERPDSEFEELQKQVSERVEQRCQLRYQALEAAREYFGRTEFDRFLYETQAGTAMEAGVFTPRLRAARARQERGCFDGS